MRRQTLSLKADGADHVSSEFLAATLYRRAQSLVDDPTANLFFGRIDQQRSDALVPERWYIGRRHIAHSHGDPVVIDWRADVSTAFYPRLNGRSDGRQPASQVRYRPGPADGL